MSDPFLGEIRMVGFNFAPVGWALCQGQTMSIAQNNALFALFGTTFGGNGQATFNLPNLAGRSPVGIGQGQGLAPMNLGQVGGNENITLTQSQMPTHSHVVQGTGNVTATGQATLQATTATTGGSGTPTANALLGPATQGGRAGDLYYTGATANVALAPINVSVQGALPVITAATAGGSEPALIRNPYLGLTCIVALTGIFPSRG